MLLKSISKHVETFGLVAKLSKGSKIYRARQRSNGPRRTAADLGPPPKQFALQSNRMNPPGVPMLYGAESRQVAVAEVQAQFADVGTFTIKRDAFVVDLTSLPGVPGIFSGADRHERLGLRFLHHFRDEIVKPVARDERTHIEYIPTQIVTEYFRHNGVGQIKLDGIRYPSSLVRGGRNIVLFATQEDVEGATAPSLGLKLLGLNSKETWIKMTGVRLVRAT